MDAAGRAVFYTTSGGGGLESWSGREPESTCETTSAWGPLSTLLPLIRSELPTNHKEFSLAPPPPPDLRSKLLEDLECKFAQQRLLRFQAHRLHTEGPFTVSESSLTIKCEPRATSRRSKQKEPFSRPTSRNSSEFSFPFLLIWDRGEAAACRQNGMGRWLQWAQREPFPSTHFFFVDRASGRESRRIGL